MSYNYFNFIHSDFLKVSNKIQKSSHIIRSLGFTDYPIFIVSKDKINLNCLLIKKKDNNFYYYVSSLDFFIKYNLIFKNKINSFKNSYKDPSKFCCLFILDNFNKFLYILYD